MLDNCSLPFLVTDSRNNTLIGRAHPITKRPKKCWCCWNLQWSKGLYCIVMHLLLYGIINYTIFAVFLLFQSPSAISLFIEFPVHAASVTIDSSLAIIFAFLLLVGVLFRSPKTVLLVAWLFLLGYLVAAGYIIAIVYEGQLVVDALVYVYYGKQYPAESDVKTHEYITSEVAYYTYIMMHVFLLLLLSTYATMMSLTYYEGLLEYKNPITVM